MTRLAVAAVFALTAPAWAEDDPKKALEALQGEWKVVSEVKAGREGPKEDVAKKRVTITGDKVVFGGGPREEKATIAVDPKARPAGLEFKIGEAGKDFVVKGIYKLEKDQLTLCFAFEGAAPKEFKAAENNVLVVLEKAKK
ncbi:MAG: hypothetical protein C0501_29935 [Isosphaera sp.]|nr:hypothetical protein [Isosphaera sp.]